MWRATTLKIAVMAPIPIASVDDDGGEARRAAQGAKGNAQGRRHDARYTANTGKNNQENDPEARDGVGYPLAT